MAAAPAGDGSFRTVPMGFDKNEVNAYIDKYRQKIQEAEMFRKTCEDRISAAEKAADAAKKEAEEAKKQLMASGADFEVRLKTERRNSDLLTNQIDELKRKLKNAGSSRGGSTAEAEKKSAEIINAANAQARDIVERAKKTAQDILSSAQSASGGSSGVVSDAFIAAARNFVELVNNEFKSVTNQAAALGISAPAAVTMPDFSNVQAPQSSVPTPAPAPEASPQEVFAGTSNAGNNDMFSFGDMDNSSSDMSEDLFNMNSSAQVSEIQPIDESNTASFDADFTAALLAQSSAVTEPEPVGSDLGASDNPWASLQAEFNTLGADSGSADNNDSSGFGTSGADNPWASLQAEFNSMSGGFETDNGGGFDSFDSAADTTESYNDDPQVPNADDNAIWDFGSGSDGNSDSDDMSSDLFGGF